MQRPTMYKRAAMSHYLPRTQQGEATYTKADSSPVMAGSETMNTGSDTLSTRDNGYTRRWR